MRVVMAAVVAAIFAGAALSGHVLAATADLSPMQQCAAQWQTLKKTNKAGGQTYKAFTTTCMKTMQAATPVPAVGAAKPAAAAAVASAGKAKAGHPNRMSQCAAQWNQMKAHNKTNGMTYKQWTSQCLKSH